MSRTILSAAFVLFLAMVAWAGEDLAKRYPATLSWTSSGLSSVCEPEDVWRLSKFELSQGSKLTLACKKATVAIGRSGTNAVWAVVFPDKPFAIKSSLAGDGDEVETLFLRFAPSEVGRLFPARTVSGAGDPWWRARAGRIFRHKIGWKWYTPAGNTTIVPAGVVIADADTRAGARRFYAMDRNAGSVEYVAEFESRPTPPLAPISKQDALAAFDAVWEAFDREYAGFVLLPRLDWKQAGKELRKAAGEARTVFDAAAVISELVAHLEDLHAWVRAGADWLPGYTRERALNASWRGTLAQVGATTELGPNLVCGRTADGIGYLNVHGLSDRELSARTDEALEQLGGTWALVIDLRFNGGGDELLARELAARFVDAERVYSKNRYRSGPKHGDLGPILERRFEPRGPWRYAAPVVVLWGRRTMSSAESLALMLAQCPQVTTMGDHSAGSSGNPRTLELDCGISVNLPRWLDLDPDEQPIERVGVAPALRVEAAPEAFTDTADPVFAAALERLRALPQRERRPARD